MSPTVFRWKGYRFFFFSREERRPHVHVCCSDGEAKFWLEPAIELVRVHGLKPAQVAESRNMVEEKRNELLDAWHKHFPG
ncbi:MAG: DUF4160 domain-containing protein [bacterium]